jgi:hypothetical protein
MNNVGKPALYGLTQPTIGTFFPENHLIKIIESWEKSVIIKDK